MKSLIIKAISGQVIDDTDIEDALLDVCYNEHSSCNSDCPVYAVNNDSVGSDKPFEENRGCDCFKDGYQMHQFLRANIDQLT